MNRALARSLLGLVLPVLVVVMGYGPIVLDSSELPARYASHFGFSGAPDDSMTSGTFIVVMSIMIGFGLIACVGVALLRRPVHAAISPFIGFMGAFLAALGASILGWTVETQRGLENWHDADGPGWWLLAMVAGSVTLGGLAAYLATQRESLANPVDSPTAVPPMELGKDERAVWSRSLRNRWLLGLGFAIIASAFPMGVAVHWVTGLILVLVGCLTLAFSGIQARVDRTGLQVSFGCLPWPKKSIPIDQIVSASAIDVHPMEWGGWGYRGSLALVKKAAIVLRAGPGLRLDLLNGRTFVVTIDDPQTPAALLSAETERLGS